MLSRAATQQTSVGSQPGHPRAGRFLGVLLSVGAALALGWLISLLTAESPKPLVPSSTPLAANPEGKTPEDTGASSPSAALLAPGANNYPPKILSVEILPAKPHFGDELEARATAFDPEGDPVQLSYAWVVNGQMVTKGTNPRFNGTDLHKHDRVVVRVIPSDGESSGVEGSSQPVFITNRPPQITSSPSTAVADGIYSYAVGGTDPDGDPLQFRLSQAPEGMTIESGTGLIQWKVSTEKPWVDVGVVASDGDGAEAFQQFKLTVRSGS